MRHILVISVLALALPDLSRAAEPAKGLEPCHSVTMEGGIRGPIVSERTAPKYPEKARADKKEGLVVLEVAIRKDGTIGDVKTLRADQKDYGFDKAAIEAVKRWKFRPALRDTTPVEVRCSLVFDFALDEELEPATPAGDRPAAAPPAGR